MLVFSERQRRFVLSEYENHYNKHRPHRSLEQLPPIAGVDLGGNHDGPVDRTEVRGSLINEDRLTA